MKWPRNLSKRIDHKISDSYVVIPSGGTTHSQRNNDFSLIIQLGYKATSLSFSLVFKSGFHIKLKCILQLGIILSAGLLFPLPIQIAFNT